VPSAITAGKVYQYVDTGEPMRGGMKDVYFSPDRSYVIAFYRAKQDFNSKERLKKIVTTYYDSFFNREGGDYFKELYCWPTDMVEADGKTGMVVPTYKKDFFFAKGYTLSDGIKGKEKQGLWFASAKFRNPQFSSGLSHWCVR
jgi:hypothetical protein